MDWLQYVNNPYVFTLVVLAIVFGGKEWLGKRGQVEAPVPGPGALAVINGNGDKRFRQQLAEACQDCKQVGAIKTEITALRSDIRALERNMSEDIRGVNDRLDKILMASLGDRL